MADEAAAAPAAAPQEGEAPAEGGDAAAAAPAKKRKMLLIISGAAAVVGILVAVGVVFFLGGDKSDKKAEPDHTEVAPLSIYDVPEFNLSLLSDDSSAQHFIKIKISVELAKPGDSAAMEKLLPRLQDDWGGFLRQMRIGDMQGSGNLQRLKEGLLRRANQSLDPVAVKAVYIRELLIQ